VAAPASVGPTVAAASRSANGRTSVHQPIAAPSVRHLARKLGVDLAKVRGTGPAGRILLDDLTPFLQPSEDAAKKPSKTDTSKIDFGRPGTQFKLAGLRKKIAEKMVASKRFIPHYSYVDECNLTQIVNLRNQLKDYLYRDQRAKITYLAFVVRAVALALRDVPLVNSTFNEETQVVTLHDRYHIGIAVAAPGGLIVPVIKDADQRNLANIAKEIERLSDDARNGQAKPDDLRGGTFTVTSVGGIGGLISTPIINHPEVGILGIGKVVKRPVYDEHEELRPADIVFLSFSFDHRVVDGAVGVAFGNVVKRHLEQPAVLLLG
jgi:pyruvate dehydrogenase E2 component (dihydrolipoamide acetyltransferase)/2-oxoisovalerate dehydrogenase E2 component (dihydrolipoyl transacylase)